MLDAFQTISGIGLFCDAREGASLPLKRLTLIYGENARGKSTLAAILGSAQTNEPSVLSERATIDASIDQHVSISRSGGTSLTFEKGAWTGDLTNIKVFDSEFIEKNVHSGHEVSSDHRKNLLTFALGEKAVQAEARERSASDATKDLGTKLDLAIQELLTKTEGMGEPEFTSLTEVVDVDQKISSADTSLKSAISRRAILNQPLPVEPAVPKLDLDAVFAQLRTTLESAHSTAESLVIEHFSSRPEKHFEEWVSGGQKYENDNDCPYCGQAIKDRTLIEAYKIHFNQAYHDLKRDVADTLKGVQHATDPQIIETLKDAISAAQTATKHWEDSGVAVHAPGISDHSAMDLDLAAVRTKLVALLENKQSDLDSNEYSPEEESEIRIGWERYWAAVQAEKQVVDKTRRAIADFKRTLEAADIDAERRKLQALRLSKIRHSDEIVSKVDVIRTLREDRAKADEERKQARGDLKKRMDETLTEFSDEINKYLAMQFAAFRIDRLSSNFMGGSPRTSYGILLREREVSLSGTGKSFHTALSESDKRTMAFAFFLASTLSDPKLHEKVVVVDDPMSSFDRNRRSTTVKLLRDLAPKCAQLIVIAHDPQFLLELDEGWGEHKVVDSSGQKVWIERTHLKLVAKVLNPAVEPYTDFAPCDLPRECETKYAKNYRIVSDFVDNPSGDGYPAASAIRPLLEGYLHRRYPKLLPENSMFGKAVTTIEKAGPPSPLVGAQHLVPEMRRIAYFGGDTHHDTQPDSPWVGLSATEIRGFAREVLSIVHGEK